MLKFILSRFSLGSKNKKQECQKLLFILRRIFPLKDMKLAERRLRNIFLTFVAWKYGLLLGRIRPIILQIETVMGCNFNCVMCRAGSLKKKMMSFEDFKKILEINPQACFIIMNLSGEPFLSKETTKFIKYASFEKKMIVNIFSNFSVIPDPYEVINSGLYEIHASIDSFNPEKFRMIREGGELSKVVSNLEKLTYAKRKAKSVFPIISINSIYCKETKEDAEDIINNAIRLGVDRVKFQRLLYDVYPLHVPESEDVKYLEKLRDKYKNKIEIVLNNFEDGGDRAKGYCYLAYFMLTIRVDGSLFPCCMPYPLFHPAESLMGNIINEENFENRRENFIRDFRKNPPTFCKLCPIYYRQ